MKIKFETKNKKCVSWKEDKLSDKLKTEEIDRQKGYA
jgi:hypothetical protein